MDIMDNMDAARFKSGNVNKLKKNKNEIKKDKESKTPMVIRNLNNQ